MKTGILLVNLGTPDSATPSAVYRYLNEFLTDPRVIDIPWPQRQLLVRGIIVPFRYRSSAKSYQKIWGKEGSPLKVYSEKTALLLQELLGNEYTVRLAMRYQNPSIKNVLDDLLSQEIDQLIIAPLFPQYASATTGSIFEAVMKQLAGRQILPKLTFIDHFYSHSSIIQAFASKAKSFDLSSYDHILFSFHGLPLRQLKKGNSRCQTCSNCCQKNENRNCYSNQCYATAYALGAELNLDPSFYTICFQSRLGKDPWTGPNTQDIIQSLAKQGKKRVLVFCPSFVSDCLETLYEIGMEYEEEFRHLGGEKLDLVPSLNDSPDWIAALKSIVLKDEESSKCAG